MRKILLYSSALVAGGLLSGVAEAACIQTPSCSSLGYTSSSSCSGGTKCPFGNAWNCTASENKTELTNKITELEKQLTEIKRHINSSSCQVGNILYSDFTCNSYVIANKTPIGVVFDIVNNLAVALEQKEKVAWSTENFDIPALMPYVDYNSDYEGKKNTKAIYDYCKANNKSCPAVEYAYTYKTEGTSEGDWYLPAVVELQTLISNSSSINNSLDLLGKTKVDDYIIDTIWRGRHWEYNHYQYYYWSSSLINTTKVAAYYSSSVEKAKNFYYEYRHESGETAYYYFTSISRPILAY